MKRIKIILAALLIAVMIGLLFPTTVAYFTDTEKTNNQITIGYNKTAIDEDFVPPTGLTQGVNAYKKAVKVTNTGKGTCYVRLMVSFSDSEIEDSTGFSSDGETFYTASSSEISSLFSAQSGIHSDKYIEHLPEHWVYIDKDVNPVLGGYYYYELPITNGESTSYLFTDVTTYFETALKVRAYNILVYSESVQYKDIDGQIVGYREAWTEFLTLGRE